MASINREHQQDRKFLISRWSNESHKFLDAWGEFTHSTIGIFLKGDDEAKIYNLTFVVTASQISGKSTYASWLRYFDEVEGNRNESL